MIKIQGPKTLTIPAALGGNDTIYGLTVICATRGLFVTDDGSGVVYIDGIKDVQLVTVSLVRLLLANGAEIYGYPAFFEVEDKDAICPFSDSNETWENWGVHEGSHEIVQIGEKWYKSSAHGASGEPLPASVWGAVPDLVVLSSSEFQALLNSEPASEPMPVAEVKVKKTRSKKTEMA